MKKILSTIVFALFASFTLAEPEIKGSPRELRGFLYPTGKVVTINGQADEKAYSDKAIVSLVITTESKLLSEAISKNSSLRSDVTKSLMNTGIAAENIKSSKFSSSPQYGWFGKKPSSYKVVNRMAVSILKESHLQEIAAISDRYQEVELSDIAFEHTKMDEYNSKVKAEALEKVIEQKEFYEKSLGVKLTPIGIRDSNIRQRATRGAMVLEEAIVTASKLQQDNYSSVSKYRDQAQEPSFDEVKYEANLAVDFKIEQ